MADGVAHWNFDGRVVVVTDAGSPRGAAQAQAFASAGARVLACDREASKLEGLVAVGNGDGAIELRALDITNEATVAKLAEEISRDHNRLDVLVVNDPGANDSLVTDVSDERWAELVERSLTGGFLCTKHLGPVMFPARYGKIVFTTGPESSFGFARRAHVCAVRHAVLGLVKDVAIEMAEYQVNVNVAAAAAEADRVDPQDQDALAALTHTVLWLASDAARFVTGTLVRADQEARAPSVV